MNTEFLDSNRSIIGFSDICYLFCDLPASRLNKVRLFSLESSKIFLRLFGARIRMTLEVPSSFKIFSLPNSDIPTEIKLFNCFTCFRIKDSYRRKRGIS